MELVVIKYMLWILTMECLSIVLQYDFLIRVGCVLIIKVFFGFKMHTDVFPSFPQREHHIQVNLCQQSMRILPQYVCYWSNDVSLSDAEGR